MTMKHSYKNMRFVGKVIDQKAGNLDKTVKILNPAKDPNPPLNSTSSTSDRLCNLFNTI